MRPGRWIPLAAIPVATPAHAQCQEQWFPQTGPAAITGFPYDAVAWDTIGPAPERLIVGGSFSAAGGVAASNIASWNGHWSPLGSGTNDEVTAVTVFNGHVIAGGRFSTAGGVECNRIGRWNGSVWSPLGSGITVAPGRHRRA